MRAQRAEDPLCVRKNEKASASTRIYRIERIVGEQFLTKKGIANRSRGDALLVMTSRMLHPQIRMIRVEAVAGVTT
jgi:hypothetical protein